MFIHNEYSHIECIGYILILLVCTARYPCNCTWDPSKPNVNPVFNAETPRVQRSDYDSKVYEDDSRTHELWKCLDGAQKM